MKIPRIMETGTSVSHLVGCLGSRHVHNACGQLQSPGLVRLQYGFGYIIYWGNIGMMEKWKLL